VDVKRVLQKIRVPAGFLCAFLFFFFCRPQWWLLAVGFPFILAGLWLRVWAAGHIRKGREITRSGPYGHTRNPLYLGSFLLGFGFAVQGGIAWLVPLFAGLFLAVYYPVMRQEERELSEAFGPPFAEYRRQVPFFWPAWSSRTGVGGRFSWSQARKNHEYDALLGALLAEAILIAKIIWFGGRFQP